MAAYAPNTEKPEAARPADPTIGALVNSALQDLSALVRDEIALAKAETMGDIKKGVISVVMFLVAAVFAVFGLIYLLHTAAWGLVAAGLSPWLGYLIVALVLFVLAVIVALTGLSKIKKVDPKPERTIATTKDTIDTLKRSTSGEATAAVRRSNALASGATQSSSPVKVPANPAVASDITTAQHAQNK